MHFSSPLPAAGGSIDVLLVEDEAFTRERVELLLEAAGLGCVGVQSALEARAALETLFFPIVIIDRMLGDADGIELCGDVRRLSRDGHPYILLLSALDSAEDLAKGLAAGADDYLSKRASDCALIERLQHACSRIQLPRKL